jgi:tripartite-type tricarboxylate transporter receptor subunit TctC
MRALLYSGLIASLLLVAASAGAQTYPIKPIRVVVPFAPGGGTDAHTRTVGQKLSERWGQPVLVDNRSGANGNIGAALVAKSPADGYTLMATSGSFATNPGVYDSLPFDPIRSFDAVAMLSPTYYAVVVPAALPVRTLKELIALGRKSNGKLTAAISGIGSPSHLAGELFRTMTKISFVSVPYRGTGPALTDLLAGQADLMFCDSLAAAPHVKAGKLKALAVSSLKRIPTLPEVPPAAEAGVPGFEAISWSGLFAPAGTPRPIVKQLNSEINAILRLPDVQQRLYSDGTAFGENTPEWMAAFVKREIEKWTRVAKASGTRAE